MPTGSTVSEDWLGGRVLVAYHDLYLAGLMEPSPQKVLRVVELERRVPESVRQILAAELPRIVGIVFLIRVVADNHTATIHHFLTETADVLYQLFRDDQQMVEQCRMAFADLRLGKIGQWTALALYVKHLAIQQGLVALEGQGDTLRWCSS